MLDEDIPGAEAPAVVTDYYEGASKAVRYLIDLGHRKIAFIKGRMATPSSKRRLEGYVDTLIKNNLRVDERLIKPGDFSYESGYEATKQLLNECAEDFTAIFCSCDLMAVGAIQSIREVGKSVPPLTTVAQPNLELAKMALDLIKEWTTERETRHFPCESRLIIRQSCRRL